MVWRHLAAVRDSPGYGTLANSSGCLLVITSWLAAATSSAYFHLCFAADNAGHGFLITTRTVMAAAPDGVTVFVDCILNLVHQLPLSNICWACVRILQAQLRLMVDMAPELFRVVLSWALKMLEVPALLLAEESLLRLRRSTTVRISLNICICALCAVTLCL